MVINSTDNTKGYSGFAETILGNIAGIAGNGRLVSIEFLVVGYGSADLTNRSSKGQPTYNREADFNLDGYITSADLSVL